MFIKPDLQHQALLRVWYWEWSLCYTFWLSYIGQYMHGSSGN